MRFVAMTTAVLPCSLVPGPGQAQTTAVQPDQSPQQADQTRGQERVRGEDVRSAATGRLNRAVLIAPGMLARRMRNIGPSVGAGGLIRRTRTNVEAKGRFFAGCVVMIKRK